MKKNSNILAELFSANNTHDSETTEIRKKTKKKATVLLQHMMLLHT